MIYDGTMGLWIGNLSLNTSFLIYLIVYIPQLVHNKKKANIVQLSLGLHFLLFFSYFFDLFYGFADGLPWQYKTVSIVGLILATIQHIQLLKFFIEKKAMTYVITGFLFLVLSAAGMYYFFITKQGVLTPDSIVLVGSLARGFGIIYCFPQIIKNRILKSGNAICFNFIYLNLVLAVLDTISSWCLGWGWPNKLASPVNIIIMLVMRHQVLKYDVTPSSSIPFLKTEVQTREINPYL